MLSPSKHETRVHYRRSTKRLERPFRSPADTTHPMPVLKKNNNPQVRGLTGQQHLSHTVHPKFPWYLGWLSVLANWLYLKEKETSIFRAWDSVTSWWEAPPEVRLLLFHEHWEIGVLSPLISTLQGDDCQVLEKAGRGLYQRQKEPTGFKLNTLRKRGEEASIGLLLFSTGRIKPLIFNKYSS